MFGSKSDTPAPPPEVPEEFADTYRQAYEAALAGAEGAPTPVVAPPAVPTQRHTTEPGSVTSPPAPATESEPQGVRISGPLFADGDPVVPTGFLAEIRSSGLFVPVLIALVGFILVSGIYYLGFGSSEPTSESASEQPQQSTPYDGQVSWQHDLSASGTCGRGKQVGANGPGRAVDGKIATAWVCGGKGVEMALTIELPDEVEIGQIGLIPGQASTDRTSGTDLYATGNLISKVRWTIGKTTITQDITGPRTDRQVQHLRIPATSARTIKLEILEVAGGKRNQTSISEVVIGATG